MQMNFVSLTICNGTFWFHKCMVGLRRRIMICYYKSSLCNSLIYIATR